MNDIFGEGWQENDNLNDEDSSYFEFCNVIDHKKDEPMLAGFSKVTDEAYSELTQQELQTIDQGYNNMPPYSSSLGFIPQYLTCYDPPAMVDSGIYSALQPKNSTSDDGLQYGLLHRDAKSIKMTPGARIAMVNAGVESIPQNSTRDTFSFIPGTSHSPNGSSDIVQLSLTTSKKKGDQIPPVSEKEAIPYHNLIKLPSRQTKLRKKAVPVNNIDDVYNDKRAKNTLAARRCRQKQRVLDESRVSMIKTLAAENECLRKQVEGYAKNAEITKDLREEIKMLKQVLQKI